MGCKEQDFPEKVLFRARQNVILELGYFLSKLGRKNVMALLDKNKVMELPSDYIGVLYTPFDSTGNWRYKLADELKSAGYKIDKNRL
jgi:predicted nucleotide-binding protein